MGKTRYSVFVQPEGETRRVFAGRTFTNKLNAETFVNIESVAGMGESYHLRAKRGKKSWWHD